MDVLVRELTAIDDAFGDGTPIANHLPNLPIQYSDFAAWQIKRAESPEWQAHLDYWRDNLAGAPGLRELPTDKPRPAARTMRGFRTAGQLDEQLTRQMRELARREGVTLNHLLFAAFFVLLHRYTGQDDIVVGTPSANRDRSEIEGLIGFFVNMLPIRIDLAADPTFKELLNRVKRATADALSHGEIPFEKLVEELQPERSPSHTPFFTTVSASTRSRSPSATTPASNSPPARSNARSPSSISISLSWIKAATSSRS